MTLHRLPVAAALALSVLGASPANALTELLMFEQPGCVYCARWNADVAPEYPKTAEGKAAPLRRVQLHDQLPSGVRLVSQPVFTPTFVLVRDGEEVGRIEGYPGEDFFWPLLGALIAEGERKGGAD